MKKIFFVISIMFLTGIIFAEVLEPEMTPIGVRFSYKDKEATKVSIAGEFNNWVKDKMMLKKDDKGIWSTVVPLKEGRYEYKFIIDGEWMSGGNLSVIIKKDKNTGQLVIEKPRGVSTKYAEKIKFGGQLGVETKIDFTTTTMLDTQSHMDLDFYFNFNQNTAGYARTQLRYQPTQQSYDFSLLSSYFDIIFDKNNKLQFFNNYQGISFDNPTHLFDTEVPLIIDNIVFPYETLPEKSSGFGLRGIDGKFNVYDINTNLVLASRNSDKADIMGLRIKKEFSPIQLGISGRVIRGEKWLYANDWNWFADPTTVAGRVVNASNISEWYQGFVEEYIFGGDFKFNIFKQTSLYVEYLTIDKGLKSYYWNEGYSGGYAKIEKKFAFYTGENVTYGITQKIKDIKLNLKSESYSASGQELMMGTNFSSNKVGVQISVPIMKQIKINSEIETKTNKTVDIFDNSMAGYYPYSEQYYLKTYDYKTYSTCLSSIPTTIPENVNKIFFGFDWNNSYLKFMLKLGYSQYLKDMVSKNDLNVYTVGNKTEFKVGKNLVFEWFPRMFYLKGMNEISSFSNYLGVSFDFKNDCYIKFGYGIYPIPWDLDVGETVDVRENILYNVYSSASGLSEDSIKNAEKLLADKQMVIIRAGIRF